MTPQERDVIAGIFDRLKQAANQPRDPEAERFIADRLREQPYAPYAMAQSVYVQEQALTNLQAQVEDLQAQVRDLQNRPAEAPAQAGGFLSGIFGGAQPQPGRPRSVPAFPQRADGAPSSAWNTQAQPTQMQPAPGQPGMQQPGPWANQGAQQPGRGGGFMASALTTAAGVAGGMMLGNVLTNAFSGHKAGEAKAAETASADSTAKSDSAGSQTASDNSNYNDGSSDSGNYQQAANQAPADEGYDDGSSGMDDDDSWA
ncbi:DUF2076 domain-containing protein [Bosea sp. PAMC 26642]|uniref:DUF2076 domain-containing protein n=1 Tax=Bosea sp. (strain PAMC 26642) TaxID=1792307 RepID=UPI0009E74B76|nr:DUF2076 domain-containing protein [Bosea sp. PAMC 26642]